MSYEPKYSVPSGAKPVKTDLRAITINGKSIPGYQTTFSDGTSKWIRYEDASLSSNFDYSSLTGSKKSDGTWSWSGTTDKSLENLSGATGLTKGQIEDGLYKTPELQNSLNGTRVLQLGGTKEAQKIDQTIPQSSGTSVNPDGPVDQGSTPESGATSDQVKDASGKFEQGKLGGQAIQDGELRTSYTGGARGGNYYIYPIDMSAQQDRIKFTMFRYAPKNVSVSNISSSTQSIFSGSNTKGSAMGTVYLPVQPSISDSNAVSWGEDTLNSLDAIAATAAYGAIQGGGAELSNAASGVADLISGDNNNIKAAIAAAAAGAAVNKSFLTRTTGGIINPNLELLFQGPSLRSFMFTFSMSAREQKEAEEIKRIIRFFKQGMSVKRSQSFLFLKTPNVFDIQYEFGAGKEHPYLNKIKTCALQNCTVNYTPAGNYATFENGAMTQYDMTLTFGEIDPIYDDDYGTEDNTTNIGY